MQTSFSIKQDRSIWLGILTINFLVGSTHGCVRQTTHPNSSVLSGTACPSFEVSGNGDSPATIQFSWGQTAYEGSLIGCGNGGVVYKFQHPDGPKIVKIFYTFHGVNSYPEEALFVDRRRDLIAIAPEFAQQVVPTVKASILYNGKAYKTLVKTFINGKDLLTAPREVIDQFYRSYDQLHAKSLGLPSGKFYITDLHPNNVLYDGKKLWIIDGSVGGIPPGKTMTFETICRKQKWCQERLTPCRSNR